jgi:O-methyltransferase
VVTPELWEELEDEVSAGAKVAILGATSTTVGLVNLLSEAGSRDAIVGVFSPSTAESARLPDGVQVRPIADLQQSLPDLIVVADDVHKEELLEAAIPHIVGLPRILIFGFGHFSFRDPIYQDELQALPVPSLANGYPNSRAHIFQCLCNAARLGLRGVVAELGMFQGGTTMFISRVIERLGAEWPIIGFDTFTGFPKRTSPLDLYSHQDCAATSLQAVREYLKGRRVEIVPGDITSTHERLIEEDLVLTFFDTDNFSPASAALRLVRERTVVGGCIVFDHFSGADRFLYTIGERIAAKSLLDDPRYFHLHGTGVFYRQR